jgi:hypothetical protein
MKFWCLAGSLTPDEPLYIPLGLFTVWVIGQGFLEYSQADATFQFSSKRDSNNALEKEGNSSPRGMYLSCCGSLFIWSTDT